MAALRRPPPSPRPAAGVPELPAGVPGPYVTGAGSLRRGAGGRRRAGFPAAGRLNTADASLSSSRSWELSPRPGRLRCPPVPHVGSRPARWPRGCGALPVRPRELRAHGSGWERWKVTRRELCAGIAPWGARLALVSLAAALGWAQPAALRGILHLPL